MRYLEQKQMDNLRQYLLDQFDFIAEEVEQILECFTRKSLIKNGYFGKGGEHGKHSTDVPSGGFIDYQNVHGEQLLGDFAFAHD